MKIKKFKFTKYSNRLIPVTAFLFVVLTSPWMWLLIRNWNSFGRDIRLIDLGDQQIMYEINSDRGLLNNGIPSPAARLLVNKPYFYFLEISERYFETFDTQFLFFNGDKNIYKSTRTTGPLYLSLLPFILFGLFNVLKGNRKKVLIIFFLAALPPAFVQEHFETFSRIPVLLVITYIACLGFVNFVRKYRKLSLLLLFLYIFEFSRFVHDFFIHYPTTLNK